MTKGHIGTGAARKPAGRERPVRGDRRQRRAAETRIRIFRAALQLIATRGLAGVTVEDITEAADVGKGTFFNYFPTKDHVLGVMAEIQISKVREAAHLAHQESEAIHDVVHYMVQRLAEEPGRSPSLARAFVSSFLASEAVREIIRARMLEGRQAMAEVVRIGQQRGEIRRMLDPEKVTVQLVQSCLGAIVFWSLHELPSLAAHLEDTFQHFWRSVAVSVPEQAS